MGLHRRFNDRHTVVVEEQFPGELETLRADNVCLRRLLKLSEEQARAADTDQRENLPLRCGRRWPDNGKRLGFRIFAGRSKNS
jgi:hypothetical protein